MPIDTRAIPDMLHWYEGMLLMPEHFQSAGRRQELVAAYLAQIAAPYAWGVSRLETEMADGLLRVLALDAVMPDGLIIRYRSDRPEEKVLEVDLKPHMAALEAQKKLGVHLVVVAWNDNALGQDGAEAGVLQRYRSVRGVPLERDDSDTAESEPAVEDARERPWLRPIFKLHVTEDGITTPPAKYVSLPLARIGLNAEAGMALDRYEPPRIELAGINGLYECARDIAVELRAKAQFLNDRLQRSDVLPDRSPNAAVPSLDMQLRMLARQFQALRRNVDNLQALARTVPRLEALIKDRSTHPFAMYLVLCDVVGDLAMLGGDLSLPDIPAYAHLDPLIAFDFLEKHIRQMLETLNQRYKAIPFERVTSGRFELAIKPGDLGGKFVLGAVRAKGTPAGPVVDWMKNAVIAGGDKVAELKRLRVSGASRHLIDRDEMLDLSAPAMTSLFRVETDDSGDGQDGVLVVEYMAAEAPLAILLYTLRELSESDAAAP